MKKKITLAVALLFVAVPTLFAGGFAIYDFSSAKVGKFPSRWRTWPLQRDKAEKVYSVQEENGKRFIHASDSTDESQQIFMNFYWDVKKYPILNWTWRAKVLPEGAKESDDNLNDSACAIYVVVGQYTGNAMKYAWSTSLPVGETVSRREGKLKIKIVESGPAKIGKWISEKRNVLQDYKEVFGSDLNKNPSGIAILTDGNATHKPAECDYAEISVSSE